jgi:hypothetical protein
MSMNFQEFPPGNYVSWRTIGGFPNEDAKIGEKNKQATKD